MAAVTRRVMTVYAFIRIYIEEKYLLSHSIPDGIKQVCLDFYGRYFESFIAQKNNEELKVTMDDNENIQILSVSAGEWNRARRTTKHRSDEGCNL